MEAKVTAKQVIAEVRKIAEERPGVVYIGEMSPEGFRKCSYSDGICTDGTVGCLFGQALTALKVPTLSKDGICEVLRMEFPGVSIEDQIWCESVQVHQDAETPWSVAVFFADEEVNHGF